MSNTNNEFLDLFHRDNFIYIFNDKDQKIVYNKKLKKKTIIRFEKDKEEVSKFSGLENFELIINNLKKLSLLKISNIANYISDDTRNNRKYYEVDFIESNLNDLISNKNELQYKEFIEIFVELLYTIMLFRKYNYQNRNININTIGYIIDTKVRTYIIDDNITIKINNLIHPIITNFDNGIFEIYDQDNEDNYCDTDQLQDSLLKLLEIVRVKTVQTDFIQSIFDMFGNDDLTSNYITNILKFLISNYDKE